MKEMLVNFHWDESDRQVNYIYKISGSVPISEYTIESLIYDYFNGGEEALLSDFLNQLEASLGCKIKEYSEVFRELDDDIEIAADYHIFFG